MTALEKILISLLAICFLTGSMIINKISSNIFGLEKRVVVLERNMDDMKTTQLDDSFMETDYYKQHNLGIVTKEYLFSFHQTRENKPFVIMFVMKGCHYCQMAEKELQTKLNDDGELPIEFYFVNTAVNDLSGEGAFLDGEIVNAENYVVNATPTFLVYDGINYKTYTGSDKLELVFLK